MPQPPEIKQADRAKHRAHLALRERPGEVHTFAIVFILTLFAFIIDGGIGFLERKSLRRQTTQEGGQITSL